MHLVQGTGKVEKGHNCPFSFPAESSHVDNLS